MYRNLTQHISLARNTLNDITSHIALLYNYTTYTKFSHNKPVYYATYEITLHNMWFHFEIKHGHMFLFPFTLSFLQYSIWRKVPVTGLSQQSTQTHHVKPAHSQWVLKILLHKNYVIMQT